MVNNHVIQRFAIVRSSLQLINKYYQVDYFEY